RLVSRRALDRLRVLSRRRDRALAPRPRLARVAPADAKRRGEPRAALLPRRAPPGVRLHGLRGALARLRDGPAGRRARRAAPDHRAPRERSAALLLQPLRSLPLAELVPRRDGDPPRLEPRARLGDGRLLAHARGARRRGARDPPRRDRLEGAPRLVARRPPRRLRVVPRPAVAPDLDHDGRGRGSGPAHLRRVRRDGAALVARREADRLRLHTGGGHPPGGPGRPRRPPRGGARRAAEVPRADRAPAPAAPGRALRRALRRAGLGRRCGGSLLRPRRRALARRRRLRPLRAPLRGPLLPRAGPGRARAAGGPGGGRGAARDRDPARAP